MTTRVTHHLAKTTGTAPCSRCLDTIDVTGGQWIAAELDAPHAVCDRCAERDDPAGLRLVEAFRRMAGPQHCRCAPPGLTSDGRCQKCGRHRGGATAAQRRTSGAVR
jgi:hypothetical protein